MDWRKERKGKGGERQTLEKVERASCTSRASLRARCVDFPSGCAFGCACSLQIVGVGKGRRIGESHEPRSEWG